MIKEIKYKGKKCFKCGECGFIYETNQIAQQCEAWCKKHKSCNLQIIKNAVKK